MLHFVPDTFVVTWKLWHAELSVTASLVHLSLSSMTPATLMFSMKVGLHKTTAQNVIFTFLFKYVNWKIYDLMKSIWQDGTKPFHSYRCCTQYI